MRQEGKIICRAVRVLNLRLQVKRGVCEAMQIQSVGLMLRPPNVERCHRISDTWSSEMMGPKGGHAPRHPRAASAIRQAQAVQQRAAGTTAPRSRDAIDCPEQKASTVVKMWKHPGVRDLGGFHIAVWQIMNNVRQILWTSRNDVRKRDL